MYELLARHPQILPPTPKEPGFFAWPAVARAATQRWYVKDVLRLREACEPARPRLCAHRPCVGEQR